MNKIHLYFLVALAAMSEGCAHVHVESWDGKQAQVCGNKRADEDDFQDKAAKLCRDKTPKLIGGGAQETGDLHASGMPFHRTMGQDKQYCRTFVCE
jgi:hypothetical protein